MKAGGGETFKLDELRAVVRVGSGEMETIASGNRYFQRVSTRVLSDLSSIRLGSYGDN